MGDFTVRLLAPARASALPEWEVSLDGEVIGWIEEYRRRGMRGSMFRAHGLHPLTGKTWYLNASPDRDERVLAVVKFHREPASSRGHEVATRS